MAKKAVKKQPPQKQHLPGSELVMDPRPLTDDKTYLPSGVLSGKVAVITGGDSGIGKAVAILFAKEKARIMIVYLNEHKDARETKRIIEAYGGEVMLMPGDISDEAFCKKVIGKTIRQFGQLDILINNAAVQHDEKRLEDVSAKNLQQTFAVNIFSMFYLTKAALPHLKRGASVINTASVTAYRGSPELLDYSASKGAVVAFTRSLASNLADKGIRVNAVAPGPIWTPLIPASFSAEKTSKHGTKSPFGRAGQPIEVAPAYLFLASAGSSYMSGQVLHPNGGEIVNG